MKNITINIAAIAMLFAASCSKTEVQPQAGNNQAAVNTNNQRADASTDIVKFPIDFTFTVIDCQNGFPAGKDTDIHLTGDLKILTHTTINGNNFQTKIQTQPVGVVGEGIPSGAKYQGNGVTETIITGSFVNGHYDSTWVNNFRLVGQGGALKFLQHNLTHLTINANGETTVSIDNESIECK